MTGLNDVRVLRNFLGDEVHEDDHEIPKYTPKKLNMGRLGNIRIRNGSIQLDRTSKNDEYGVRIPQDTEFIAGPKGIYRAGPNEQIGGTGMGRGVFLPEGFTPYITPESTEQKVYGPGYGINIPSKGRYEEGKYIPVKIETPEKKSLKQSIAERQQIVLDEENQLRQQRIGMWREKENQRLGREIQNMKFQKSPFGKFVKAVQDPELARWGGRVQENIGQNMGGSIIGSFEDKGATTGLRRAILAKQAWVAFTIRKYANKGMSIDEAKIAGGVGTVGEQKRYAELSRAIERAQSAVAATGFMGGVSGRTMIRSNARPQNLSPFTQLGRDAGGSYGSFSPEAFSRLGVSQGLQAVRPENKWDALVGRGSGGGQNISKIAEIIGKAPNPLGNVESAAAKVKRFL